MRKSTETVIGAIAFGAPFAVFIVAGLVFGRWNINNFPNEPTGFYFGAGLGFLLGYPTYDHVPGYSFVELAGAILSFCKLPVADLTPIHYGTIASHLLALFIVAPWTAILARRLNVGAIALFVLSLATLSMPTVAVFAFDFGPYFIVPLVMVPVCLGFLTVAVEGTPPRWVPWASLAGLGFAVANLYLVICVAVSLGAVLLLGMYRYGVTSIGRRFGGIAQLGKGWWIAIVVFLIPFVYAVNDFISPDWNEIKAGRVLQVTAIAGVIVLAIRRIKGGREILTGLAFPFLVAWALSLNLYVVRWGASAKLSFLKKGGAAPHLPFAEVWARMDIPRFIQEWAWHWLLAGAVVVVLGLAVVLLFRRVQRSDESVFVAVFAGCALLLNAVISADVSFLQPSSGLRLYGAESRYFQTMVGPLAVVAVWAFRRSRPAKWPTMAALVIVSVFSLREFIAHDALQRPSFGETNRLAERVIEDHLAADPRNIVICMDVDVPTRTCGMLHWYNAPRRGDSLHKFSLTTLRDGRIRYVGPRVKPEDICGTPANCPVNPGNPDRILVVHSELPGDHPDLRQTWVSPTHWRYAASYLHPAATVK